MHHRIARTVLAGVLAAGMLTTAAPMAAAQERGTFSVGPTTRFEAAPGTVLSIPGVGRFLGTVEIRQRSNGSLMIINELSMDEYLMGLAEMPASWHMEALKAQAVAGRTYAWYSINLGTFRERGLPYDICPTVDCQVFSGYDFVAQGNGARWAEAVRATSNQVLVHEGQPILARFFSSSGGHTKNNEDVFGYDRHEGPRPYLKGVPDPEDAISPWHRWRVELTHREFNEILSRGSTVRGVVPVASVQRVPKDGAVDQLRLTGKNGRVVEISASKFRRFMSEVGPSLYPSRFPGKGHTGKTTPEAMPTSRLNFSLASKPGVVIIEGEGWGHGVGLSQWGARGKAEKGWPYDDIVAAYYQGLRPQVVDQMPRSVRVGVKDSVREVIVRANGPYRVVQDGRQVDLRGGGKGWHLARGGPSSMRATGPIVDWRPHDGTVPTEQVQAPPATDVADGQPQAAGNAPVPDPSPSFGDQLRDAIVNIAPRIGIAIFGR